VQAQQHQPPSFSQSVLMHHRQPHRLRLATPHLESGRLTASMRVPQPPTHPAPHECASLPANTQMPPAAFRRGGGGACVVGMRANQRVQKRGVPVPLWGARRQGWKRRTRNPLLDTGSSSSWLWRERSACRLALKGSWVWPPMGSITDVLVEDAHGMCVRSLCVGRTSPCSALEGGCTERPRSTHCTCRTTDRSAHGPL